MPILLALAALCLGTGYALPAISVHKLGIWHDHVSLLGTTHSIFDDGHPIIAFVFFAFALLFPVVKIFLLAALWYGPISWKARSTVLRWLHHLARWSMLDVFLVAVLLVMAKANIIVRIRPEPGLYLFTAGLFLSLVLSLRIDFLTGPSGKPRKR